VEINWETINTEYMADQKKQGKKIVGYTCVYTPVEILEAGGIMPFRIRGFGNSRTDQADARLSRYNCGFCRSCLQLGLEGKFDFLDGIIEVNGCDQLRGMFENWQYARPTNYFHYLKVPHLTTKESMDFFADRILDFKESIEKDFGGNISKKQLWKEMERQNRIRGTLRKIHALREREQPAISGQEALSIVLAGGQLTAKDYEKYLQKTFDEIEDKSIKEKRARLLFGGSVSDEVDIIRTIEKLGGAIVADSDCFGSRVFMPEVKEGEKDPYKYLARQYLGNSLCPRMYDEFDKRFDFIYQAVLRGKVDGVILVHNKFCDIHGVDNVLLRIGLEEKEIPVLLIEKEYGAVADLGRIKTRVQAFLERIGR